MKSLAGGYRFRVAFVIIIGFVAPLAVCASASAQQYVFGNAAFPTSGRPLGVVTADFNHDRVMDLAVVNQCSNDPACLVGGVSILLGNPDGTFQPYSEYSTGNLPKFGITADLNADGDPDMRRLSEEQFPPLETHHPLRRQGPPTLAISGDHL